MAAAVTNIFAGLSLVLDRMSERRDEEAWLAEQAGCREARYLLLNATGESYLLQEAEGLRWLSGAERNAWFADVPASLLGIAGGCPHFLVKVDGHRQRIDFALHIGILPPARTDSSPLGWTPPAQPYRRLGSRRYGKLRGNPPYSPGPMFLVGFSRPWALACET